MAVINTNISSLNAQRNLGASASGLATSLQRLSSGLRINSAKDDAAGLAISERMTSQIRGTTQAARNANDGISLAQTAEGDLTQIGNNLQRMRELAVQSSNATNSASDRAALQTEVSQLKSEIDRVSQNSSFNGVKLLDGSFKSATFQIGANNTANDKITVDAISSARTSQMGSTTAVGTSATAAALSGGDLTLNGVSVGASSSAGADSIASAINAVSGDSGVIATASTQFTSATSAASGALTAGNTFSVNGVSVGDIAAGGTASGQGTNVAAAINKITSQTGVSATSDATGKLTLTAADGRNIQLSMSGTAASAAAAATNKTAAEAATGLSLGTQADPTPTAAVPPAAIHGTLSLSSTDSAGIVVGGSGALSKAGLTAGTYNPSTADSVANIDISTAANAGKALSSLDAALNQINKSRANLGALQNRFSSVVTSLQTTTENLSASRSRIQDTDFAAETANLTRGQILQQAGTAMLAQANSLPNGVLSLLRG
jgi:flagellin